MKGTLKADGLRVDRYRFAVQGERFAGVLRGSGQVEWDDGSLQIVGAVQGERIRFAVGDDVFASGGSKGIIVTMMASGASMPLVPASGMAESVFQARFRRRKACTWTSLPWNLIWPQTFRS